MSAVEELHRRYQQAMLGKANDERIQKQLADIGGGKERAGNVRVLVTTKQGRERMRGVPIMAQGVGGTQQDTSPTHWIDDLPDEDDA